MGPVKDMRDMLNVTMAEIDQTYDENYQYHNSDQFYFQNVWAKQEIQRSLSRDGMVHPPFLGE